MDNKRVLYQPENANPNSPVWMNEITSFESPGSDSEDETYLSQLADTNASRNTDYQTDSTCETKKSIEAAVEFWIQSELSGSNVEKLTPLLSSFRQSTNPETYQKYLDLSQVIQQLNQEFQNAFDNYLCFFGSNDETRVKKLFEAASARAVQSLKNREHSSSSGIETLLVKACEKLFTFYLTENRTIVQNEQQIAEEVTETILNFYLVKIQSYIHLDPHNLNRIHQNLRQYCLNVMNKSLDFSAKMNRVHNLATQNLEAKIQNKFEIVKTAKQTQVAIQKSPLVPPRPKPRSNINTAPTLSTVQKCLLDYKKNVDAKYPNLISHRGLCEAHVHAISAATSRLSPDEKIAAKLGAKYYFCYISEMFEARSSHSTNSTPRTVCMNFADEALQIGIHVALPCSNWNFDQKNLTATSFFKLKDKNYTALEFLFMFSKQTETKIKAKIVEIFTRVRKEAESTSGNFEQLCIIIPTWLSLDQIAILRELAHQANFKKAFFLRETALASFSLYIMPKYASQILVGVSVGISGAFVEIFCRDVSNSLRLLAAASYEFDLGDISPQTKKFLCFEYSTSASRTPRASMICQENPIGILQDTYNKAIAQLDDNLKSVTKYCFYLIDSNSTIWGQAYKQLVVKNGKNLIDIGTPAQNFAINIALMLTKQTSKIRQIIIDHAISFEDVAKSEQMSQAGLLSKSSVNQSKQISSNSKASTVRAKLLSMCKQMREQAESGKVKLGVLTSKLIKETLDKAQGLAESDTTSEQTISEQLNMLDAHAKQYKFDVVN